MNNRWSKVLDQHLARAEGCVLVTILSTKGSTPRAVGSKMLVSEHASYQSIGGGHLEHQAIKFARQQLSTHSAEPVVKHFALGASLGQCCGGSLELLFETFLAPQQNVVVFGAGHVAKALIPILGQLPCSVLWVDSRAELFPQDIPDNTRTLIHSELTTVAQTLPQNSYVLIMTHNHQLDQQLCEALLSTQSSCFIGLIGSLTKWNKFKLRLARKSFSEQQIASICCPVGDLSVASKLPMEVAVSISSQFISYYQQQTNHKLTLVNQASDL